MIIGAITGQARSNCAPGAGICGTSEAIQHALAMQLMLMIRRAAAAAAVMGINAAAVNGVEYGAAAAAAVLFVVDLQRRLLLLLLLLLLELASILSEHAAHYPFLLQRLKI
jgi:hypothetical protein